VTPGSRASNFRKPDLVASREYLAQIFDARAKPPAIGSPQDQDDESGSKGAWDSLLVTCSDIPYSVLAQISSNRYLS
jgi:hypothetical protein